MGIDSRSIPYYHRRHAWKRPPAGWDVQLRVAGAAGAKRPPVAPDSPVRRRDPARDVAGIRPALCGRGAAVDPAGAATSGAAAPDLLLDSQRAAADGAAR